MISFSCQYLYRSYIPLILIWKSEFSILKFQMTSQTSKKNLDGKKQTGDLRTWPSYMATPDGAIPNLNNNHAKIPQAETQSGTANSRWYDPPRIDVQSKLPYKDPKTSTKKFGTIDIQPKQKCKCNKALLLLLLLLLLVGIGVGIYFAVKSRRASTGCPQDFIRFQGQCLVCPSYSRWSESKCIRNNGQSVSWIVYNQQTDTPITEEKGQNSTCSNGYILYESKCIQCPSTSTWNGTHCVRTSSTEEVSRLEALVDDYLSKHDHKAQDNTNISYLAFIKGSNKTLEVSNIPEKMDLKIAGVNSGDKQFTIPLAHGLADKADIPQTHHFRQHHLRPKIF